MPRRTQWELFVDRHKPVKNTLHDNMPQDAPFEGFMFETYGKEFEFVRSQDFHKVFTLVEGDTGGKLYVASGFHRVNRMGYFVVEVPWTAENELKVYYAG